RTPVHSMPDVIISVKDGIGPVNLQKTLPMKAFSRHCMKRTTANASINWIIMLSTIKSSTWSSKAVQQRHSACAALHVNRHVSCKSWVQKVKYVVIWMIIRFLYTTFSQKKRLSLSSVPLQACMVAVIRESCETFYVI